MALGAVIPIEVICESAGIGQLAWQAAWGRDLPLLVNLTLLVTMVTLAANMLSDLLSIASMCHRVVSLHEGQIVGCGTRDEIFRHTQHPYTCRLIEAPPKSAV